MYSNSLQINQNQENVKMSSEPAEFYPTPITSQPNSSRSNGSFGPVFVVLAVIIVVSAVACVLGRLCGRRRHHPNQASHNTKAQKQRYDFGPKEWEPKQKPSFGVRDGDIEFGFDKKIPGGKTAAKGGGAAGQPPYNGGGRRPEFRFSDNV